MATEGGRLVAKSIELARWTRDVINKIPGLYSFGEDRIGNPGIYSLDPTKITVTVKGLGMKGSDAERILRFQYKIQAELSDMYNLLFLITLGDNEQDVQNLVKALSDMASNHMKDGYIPEVEDIYATHGYPAQPEQVISPREALFGRTKQVAFEQASGKICAGIVTFYPPGIPILCPGERISEENIEYCRRLQAASLHISGPEDYTLTTIKVVE